MRGRGALAARAAGLAAVLALGCTLRLPRQPVPAPEEGDWPSIRDEYTRWRRVYDELDTRAFASATYQPWVVREARVRRVARWKRMSDAERDALLAAERADADAYEDFFVAFFTPDYSQNDLDAPRSMWRVALDVPGAGQVLPIEIRELRTDATLAMLYDYVGNFDTLYRVRFPRWKGETPLAEIPFSLRIASAIAALDLRFGPGTPGGSPPPPRPWVSSAGAAER